MKKIEKIRMKDVAILHDRQMKAICGGSGSSESSTCAFNSDAKQCEGDCPQLTAPNGRKIDGRCELHQTNVLGSGTYLHCTCVYD
jgi:natural product precursor